MGRFGCRKSKFNKNVKNCRGFRTWHKLHSVLKDVILKSYFYTYWKGIGKMANNTKMNSNMDSNKREKTSWIMGLFALAVLCVFPLAVTDAYFNILETKYQFYAGVSIAMIVVMLGYGLINESVLAYLKEFNLKKVIKGLNVVDWSMIIFWLANVISWLFSEWRWEAFWGTSGRYNGVFLMTIYMVVYFCVTRFFTLKRWYLDAFLAVGLIVCLFGITDYFQMDLMGFKMYMVPKQKDKYTSTLGNINTYTVYAAAVMVVSAILFSTEKNGKRIVWYYANMVIACFALIMGVSDNAYLSLAALFGLSPLYLFRTKRGISRYLIVIATFFTVIQCIAWINVAFADSVIGIDSAFGILAGMDLLPVIVAALWAFAAVATYMLMKKNAERDCAGLCKGLCRAWIGVIILVIAVVAFAFYDTTVAGNGARYGAFASYLKFNESWGTNRGYVWMRAVTLWKEELTLFQKIFGYGSDTFALLMSMYYEPFRQGDGSMIIYDSVHNEYLNYLLTVGFVGMSAYIVFLGSAVVKMWKRVEGRPEVAALMFAVLAYAVQALININLPVVMPVILQLLAMGLCRTPEE